MWNVINKNIGEADVLAAAQEAFRTGRTTLKLYFMIGFPLEEDADVEGIAELCLKIRELGREMLGDRRNRLQLNVGVNNFIPKTFTPFQWLGMADRATLRRRQELLRSRLKRPGIRLTLHGVDKSFLEAALSRGGETMAAVVEAAWRKGARFDSWTEQFRDDAWRQALEGAGTPAEELATAPLPIDQPLPWDIIEGVVDREFLWEEWQKAQRGELTPDCRWEACGACGACEGAPVLAQTGSGATGPGGQGGDRPAATRKASAPADPSVAAPERPRLRYLVVFSVTGRGRYIGHLDRTEILRRGVRRAGGRLALSQGMRPKPLLSLALPLAVGVEGLHELGEFALAEEPPEDFFEHLSRALPAHMKLLDLKRYDAARSLPARVVAADYEVWARPSLGGSAADTARLLQDAVERFFALEELPIEEMREGTLRRVDVRRFVESISIETGEGTICLFFRAAVTPFGTARPEHVVKALGALAGVGLEIEGITRTQVLLS